MPHVKVLAPRELRERVRGRVWPGALELRADPCVCQCGKGSSLDRFTNLVPQHIVNLRFAGVDTVPR